MNTQLQLFSTQQYSTVDPVLSLLSTWYPTPLYRKPEKKQKMKYDVYLKKQESLFVRIRDREIPVKK